MSKPSTIYILMLVLFIAGLSTILEIGKHLRAPIDVTGDYEITWLAADGGLPGKLSLEQSGRYFSATLGDKIRLTGELQPPTAPATQPSLTMHGADDRGTAYTIELPSIEGDPIHGQIDTSPKAPGEPPLHVPFSATNRNARPGL